MIVMCLILFASLFLTMYWIKNTTKKKEILSLSPRKTLAPSSPLTNDLMKALLSPVDVFNGKDRDWPFSTQYAGLRTLHENSANVVSNTCLPAHKGLR